MSIHISFNLLTVNRALVARVHINQNMAAIGFFLLADAHTACARANQYSFARNFRIIKKFNDGLIGLLHANQRELFQDQFFFIFRVNLRNAA